MCFTVVTSGSWELLEWSFLLHSLRSSGTSRHEISFSVEPMTVMVTTATSINFWTTLPEVTTVSGGGALVLCLGVATARDPKDRSGIWNGCARTVAPHPFLKSTPHGADPRTEPGLQPQIWKGDQPKKWCFSSGTSRSVNRGYLVTAPSSVLVLSVPCVLSLSGWSRIHVACATEASLFFAGGRDSRLRFRRGVSRTWSSRSCGCCRFQQHRRVAVGKIGEQFPCRPLFALSTDKEFSRHKPHHAHGSS